MAKRKELPEDLTELLAPVIPALKMSDLQPVREAVDLSPDEFQKATVLPLQKLFAEGLANLPAPRTVKEVAAVQGMIRKAANLDRDTGTGLPQGLVPFLRPIGRRVLDVEASVMEADPFAL